MSCEVKTNLLHYLSGLIGGLEKLLCCPSGGVFGGCSLGCFGRWEDAPEFLESAAHIGHSAWLVEISCLPAGHLMIFGGGIVKN